MNLIRKELLHDKFFNFKQSFVSEISKWEQDNKISITDCIYKMLEKIFYVWKLGKGSIKLDSSFSTEVN